MSWEWGLLVKEPNICHVITSNALALETPERDHFLSFTTLEKIKEGIKMGHSRRMRSLNAYYGEKLDVLGYG